MTGSIRYEDILKVDFGLFGEGNQYWDTLQYTTQEHAACSGEADFQ